MSSPGSRATRNPLRAIKHALTGRCASTSKGRQAGVDDLGLEITRGEVSTHRRYCDACKVRGGEIEEYRVKSYNGAPRPMKMGNIASPWRYDAGAYDRPTLSNTRSTAI
jgi:hypothetical protein